ncbi:MAG: 4Fe-4S binding domain protein [Firmicutes bacterium]|nr:4Fe-4S binding domain protein [Bacillota bacterium]
MITIDESKCIGCGLCAEDCFTKDIEVIEQKAKSKRIRCIECGHCIAVCPKNAIILENYPMSEVLEYEKGGLELDENQYLRALKFRRTIRQFSKKQVEIQKIEKIIEAGRYSPTGGNQQNVSYCVVRDDIDPLRNMAIDELNKIANLSDEEKEKLNISWYGDLWKQMYLDYHDQNRKDGLFFDAGTVILVLSESVHSACIAAAHMETMVYAQGLGMLYSGFFTRAVARSKEMKEYLMLSPGQEVVACLVIGYPSIKYQRTVPRKEARIVWR